jgi:hypothetical protein
MIGITTREFCVVDWPGRLPNPLYPTPVRVGYSLASAPVKRLDLGVHVAAPFVPTVEREAMDIQDINLRQYNLDLLHCSGLLLRYILEHTMYRTIHTTYQKHTRERNLLDEQLLQKYYSHASSSSSSVPGSTNTTTKAVKDERNDQSNSGNCRSNYSKNNKSGSGSTDTTKDVDDP